MRQEIFILELILITNDNVVSNSSSLLSNYKKRLGLITLLLILSAIIIHEVKHRSNDHTFNNTDLSEFEGMYFSDPFPMLVFDELTVPRNLPLHALIVGPGKLGAQKIIQELEEKHGPLNGKGIRLRATLYNSDGKTLIELSQGVDALLEVERGYTYPIQRTAKKAITIRGEIVNAKCWFSQQDVRAGYYHQRCAKTCINNGIPPVLMVENEGGNTFYLLDANTVEGQNSIIEHVAKKVEITGEVNFQNGWSVLSLAKKEISTIN